MKELGRQSVCVCASMRARTHREHCTRLTCPQPLNKRNLHNPFEFSLCPLEGCYNWFSPPFLLHFLLSHIYTRGGEKSQIPTNRLPVTADVFGERASLAVSHTANQKNNLWAKRMQMKQWCRNVFSLFCWQWLKLPVFLISSRVTCLTPESLLEQDSLIRKVLRPHTLMQLIVLLLYRLYFASCWLLVFRISKIMTQVLNDVS